MGHGREGRRHWHALGLTPLLVLASCSGADGGDGGDAGPIVTMLALVPDTTANHEMVQIIDLGLAADRLGLTPPAPDDQVAEEDYVARLFGPRREEEPPVVLPQIFTEDILDIASWRAELGFALPDTERVLVFGLPPSRALVARTTLDPSTMVDAVLAEPVWGPEATVDERSAATVLTWPGDPQRADLEFRSGVRPLGRPGLLSIADDGTVVRALDPAQLDEILDLSDGEGTSMADNPWFGGVGRALDDAGVHEAFLTSTQATVADLAVPEILDGSGDFDEALGSVVALPPYQALGMGSTLDEDGNGLLVVSFGTPGEAEAAAMVDAFTTMVTDGESQVTRQRWSDVFTVVDSTTDGNIATITLATDRPWQGYQAVVTRDTLFMVG